MKGKNLAKRLAKHEMGWWQAHHRRNLKSLKKSMTKLYVLQFKIPYKEAFEAVEFRVEATKEHDIAEHLEDTGKRAEAEKHWKKTRNLLEKHFEILQKNIQK
ncbi:MAG: hypothetical protein WC308_03655 [archaeon]|jgi:hypothetical protein